MNSTSYQHHLEMKKKSLVQVDDIAKTKEKKSKKTLKKPIN